MWKVYESRDDSIFAPRFLLEVMLINLQLEVGYHILFGKLTNSICSDKYVY